MKEKKIKIGIACLLGCAAIQLVSHIMLLSEIWALTNGITTSTFQRSMLATYSGSGVFMAVAFVCVYFTVQELRRDNEWAWVAALVLLLFCSASWALPVAIVGLIHLLGEDVRKHFLPRIIISV